MRSPASISQIVDYVREFLRGEGLEPPFHVVGLSLGGIVAIDWATRHAAEVAGLVVVNTTLRPFCGVHRRLQWRRYPHLAAIALTRDARAKERRILDVAMNHCRDPAARLDKWTEIRRERPVSAGNAMRQLVAAARYKAPAGPPRAPLLVLVSDRDRLVHPCCSRNLAAAWKAPLRTHPSAGHDMPVEDPAWVADQVARWVRNP